MGKESGQESTSKQDALTDIETDSKPNETDEEPSPEFEEESICGHIFDCDCGKEEPNEWDRLIEMILELDPAKYAAPFTPIELQKMREIITAGRGKFPKKVIPYIELMRKFLFANYQLIAMAALAHRTAAAKSHEEASLIKPATFSDLGKVEASRVRGE